MATTRGEWGRKVRILSRGWWEVLRGGMLDPRGQPPLYVVAILSHRLVRYATGPLHAVLLVSTLLLAPRDRAARKLLGAQAAFGALALLGSRRPGLPVAGAAWYYVMVTQASLAGLVRVLADGPHATWAPSRDEP
jgi:hypothetical protein